MTKPDPSKPIVAVSGKSGCGNTTVSRLLSERLGFSLVNYTFRNLAAERGVSLAEIIALAENDFSFDRIVDARQVELARAGHCVIGSRLAIWMVPDATLKVYLTGSAEIRARRILTREGGEYERILDFTRDRDGKDHERYRKIYGIDNNDYSFADLVINTERMLPEGIVDTIEAAFKAIAFRR